MWLRGCEDGPPKLTLAKQRTSSHLRSNAARSTTWVRPSGRVLGGVECAADDPHGLTTDVLAATADR